MSESEPRSLPAHPDLRYLRDEAKRRRKAGGFPSIAVAPLAIAREHAADDHAHAGAQPRRASRLRLSPELRRRTALRHLG